MQKSITLIFFLITNFLSFGQVGINTASPQATFDIMEKKGNTSIEGLIIPRLTRSELTTKGNTLYGTNQNGIIIFISDISGGDTDSQRENITETGYYYFDFVSNAWKKLANIPDNQKPWRIAGTTNSSNKNTQHIYQNANIGIGDFSNSSNTPSEKLDVDGNVRVRIMNNAINDPGFNRMITTKAAGFLGNDSRISSRMIINENYGPRDVTTSIPISDSRVGFPIFVRFRNTLCQNPTPASIILYYINGALFQNRIINSDTNGYGGSIVNGNGTYQITLRHSTDTNCIGGPFLNNLTIQVTADNKIRVYNTTNNGYFRYTVNWIQP